MNVDFGHLILIWLWAQNSMIHRQWVPQLKGTGQKQFPCLVSSWMPCLFIRRCDFDWPKWQYRKWERHQTRLVWISSVFHWYDLVSIWSRFLPILCPFTYNIIIIIAPHCENLWRLFIIQIKGRGFSLFFSWNLTSRQQLIKKVGPIFRRCPWPSMPFDVRAHFWLKNI